MKILYFYTCLYPWNSGCWLYRSRIPSAELQKRGHEIKFIVPQEEIKASWLNYPDVVIFGVYGGAYLIDPIPIVKEFQRRGKKVVYDLDDDVFSVNPDNASKPEVEKTTNQVKELLKIADVVTTTTDVLKKRFLKYNKNVMVVPNALDFSKFSERPHKSRELRIGYTGASSHWGDMTLILNVLNKLQKKYDFKFVLQGMCGRPLIAEIYNYRMLLRQNLEPEKNEYYKQALETFEMIRSLNYVHIPFYPPEMYPATLGQLDIDIGLTPLKDNKFNRAKSCIKFYEYAATGTTTISSNVLPYKKEVNYLANNTEKDWYNKIEKLIVDKKFRDKILEKQRKWVFKNRDIKNVAKLWEKALTNTK